MNGGLQVEPEYISDLVQWREHF